ncbi:MAG: hypothetical protein GY788_07680 [bacterium]|nr:hypothetical protein [bacterium]
MLAALPESIPDDLAEQPACWETGDPMVFDAPGADVAIDWAHLLHVSLGHIDREGPPELLGGDHSVDVYGEFIDGIFSDLICIAEHGVLSYAGRDGSMDTAWIYLADGSMWGAGRRDVTWIVISSSHHLPDRALLTVFPADRLKRCVVAGESEIPARLRPHRPGRFNPNHDLEWPEPPTPDVVARLSSPEALRCESSDGGAR